MKKDFIVYKASFENGKCYIGLTRNGLSTRKSEHLYRSKIKYPLPFYNAINKYGWVNIRWDVLGIYKSLKEAESAEQNFIKVFSNNYNISEGGNAGLISAESRMKISEKLKGRVFSEEWKSKISKTVTDIFSNPEKRKILSEKVKEAMWREDVRANYLKGIENRDNSSRIQALAEHHKNQRESKFQELKNTYREGMSWESLHKETDISLGFIRKYKSNWLC